MSGLRRILVTNDTSLFTNLISPTNANIDLDLQIPESAFLIGFGMSFNSIIVTGGATPTTTEIVYGYILRRANAAGTGTGSFPWKDFTGNNINALSQTISVGSPSDNVSEHFTHMPFVETAGTATKKPYGGVPGLPVFPRDTLRLNAFTFTTTGSPTGLTVGAVRIEALLWTP